MPLNKETETRTDYLHKNDLALNNLKRLICHKAETTNKPAIDEQMIFTRIRISLIG